jgi:hypothetical protein
MPPPSLLVSKFPDTFAYSLTLSRWEASHTQSEASEETPTVTMKLLQQPLLYASTAGLAAFLVISNFGQTNSNAAPGEPGSMPRVVVVELFTSEGCSSCPPADALLKELSEQQKVQGAQIVALEEHVDYWNSLGWKDPYSAAEFSQRQSDYAHVFGTDGVYTPQMIVDGQNELVGSRSLAAREAIRKAANQPKVEMVVVPSANFSPGKPVFEVQVKNLDGISVRGETELWIVVTEKGLQTDVKAGENSGETLKHAAVVRSLRKIDTLRDPAGYNRQIQLTTEPGWKKENLAVVAFLAEKGSRKIVGAAASSLDPARAPR